MAFSCPVDISASSFKELLDLTGLPHSTDVVDACGSLDRSFLCVSAQKPAIFSQNPKLFSVHCIPVRVASSIPQIFKDFPSFTITAFEN